MVVKELDKFEKTRHIKSKVYEETGYKDQLMFSKTSPSNSTINHLFNNKNTPLLHKKFLLAYHVLGFVGFFDSMVSVNDLENIIN